MAEDEEEKKADVAENPDGEDGGKKKKLFLIIGIASAVLLGGGGAAVFLMGSDDEATPPIEGGEIPSEDGEGADGAQGEGAEGEGGESEAAGGSAADAAGNEDAKATDPNSLGDTYTFKSFHLNLGNPLENHYIKADVAIEYRGGDKQKEEIDKRLPQLRDAIGDVVSSKSREFLLGPDGKAQLRREILIRLNRYMNTPIDAVYITDMLVE